jgi:hypothetical protein
VLTKSVVQFYCFRRNHVFFALPLFASIAFVLFVDVPIGLPTKPIDCPAPRSSGQVYQPVQSASENEQKSL